MGERLRKLAKARYGLAALASLAAGLAVAAEPLHGWKFDSGVTLRETWTDNVGVSTSNAKSDFVTEIAPFISARKRGADLKVDFRYSMQNLFYLSDSERNTIRHQLAASANAELYDKHLFLDVNASASQQATSILGSTSTSNINDTGNVTDVYSLTVSPYWQQRFGTYANLFARYSRSQTTSSGNTYSGSGTDSYNLSVYNGSAFTQVQWGLNFAESSVNYDSRPDARFTTTSATLGYALTNHLRVNYTQGYQDNHYQAVSGQKTRGGFWNVNMVWVPSLRSRFELGYGDYYYGDSWTAKFTSRNEHLNWDLSYSESISTSSANLSSSTSQAGTLTTYANAGGVYIPVSQQSGTYQNINQLLTDSVYLNKSLRVNVGYNKGRGTANLGIYRTQLTSQVSYNATNSQGFVPTGSAGSLQPTSGSGLSFSTTTQTGIDFSLGWRHSTRLRSNLSLGITRGEYPEQGRTDNTRHIEYGLSQTFARSMTGSLTVRHQERDSSQANADTSENAVSASVTIPF